jgi:hypothetical protein
MGTWVEQDNNADLKKGLALLFYYYGTRIAFSDSQWELG